MSEVNIPDEAGDCIPCIQHNGALFPKFDIQAIKGLSAVKIRDDDVILVTFPKSGTHLIWELTWKILKGRTDYDDVFTFGKMFMEYTPEHVYAEAPSPRLLSSHCLLPQLSPEVMKKKPKLLSIIRNPKDIAVSYYNFLKKLPYVEYPGTWENFLKLYVKGTFFYGTWGDHVLAWEKIRDENPDWPILFLYFEDILKNPVAELRKLSRFLGVERSDEFLSGVNEACKIDKMREHRVRENDREDAAIYRKGHAGGWKNWFTVAQNERFDDYLQQKMKNSKLAARYITQ